MPPAKKRKSTNQVRREEAEALRKELAQLQSQVRELQARAAEAAMTPNDHLQRLGHSLRTKSVLDELLWDQKLVIAGVESELLNFQEKQVRNPLYTYIHLPKCWKKRRQILVGLKDEKLAGAVQYTRARSQHLNLLARHSSEKRYEDADGVFCCDRFEVNQLTGVRSLKEVYEAAKFFLTNVEISTTEALGHITVREDYDTIGDDESIGSFRLISARPSGIVTESNKVLYDKYYDHHGLFGGQPCAAMVTDSVDRDELHPYDPKSRVRLDVSATLVMTVVRRPKVTNGNEMLGNEYDNIVNKGVSQDSEDDERTTAEGDVEGEEDLTVVIQSATFLKALSPELDTPAHALHAIGDGSASWSKVMRQSIREFIDAL